MFRDIFLRYPDVNSSGVGTEVEKTEELNEEKKESLIAAANQFSDELENCVFELYCEADSQSAGAKYK